MKTANIHTEAKITLNSNFTTNGEPIHTIEFDGVVADIIGDELTKREIEIFKTGILYERERLWDESENLVDDKVMRKSLRDEKEICKKCGWSDWVDKLIENTKPIYVDKEIIGYHTELLCPKCKNKVI